uniref:Uncharacterized protein n=1 Tax=Caenorhabditis japonica TaxID=281687 RepID=A0A8R1EKL2_CAEJA
MFERMTGNGNGNKMNMRMVILDELLSREMDSSSDGSSARVNSLKQVIKRNKQEMADDAPSSLDLMRRVSYAVIVSILDTANQAAPSCTIPSDSGPCSFCLEYANSSAAVPEVAPEGLIVDEDFDRIRDVVGPSFRRTTAWSC